MPGCRETALVYRVSIARKLQGSETARMNGGFIKSKRDSMINKAREYKRDTAKWIGENIAANCRVRRVTGAAGGKRGGGDGDGETVKSKTEEPINFTMANSETVATPVAAAVHRGN